MAAKPKGLFIIAVLTILGSPKPAACETLRQLLAANGIDSRGLDASRLDQKITSYAVLNDPAVFCVASYEDDGTNFLTNILNLDVFEKSAKNWVHREIETETLTCDNRHFRPGSILEIQRFRSYIYLRTHANPSAGYTLIYTKELKFHDAVYGWLLATFKEGTMVYHNSQIHFAPTHYTEISIYNPYSKSKKQIYPMKPYQPVRLDHIANVNAAYDELGPQWFAEHNHHRNPELFNNSLAGPVVVNDEADALMFLVRYDNTDTWRQEDKLKPESFRALRERFAALEDGPPSPERLYWDLGDDLRKIRLTHSKDSVLLLFEDDRELHALIRRALETEKPAGEDWSNYFESLDDCWRNPAVWKKLAKKIATPPEYTEVVCIYRHVKAGGRMTHKELLWSDFKTRFGDREIPGFLRPELLKQIFEK